MVHLPAPHVLIAEDDAALREAVQVVLQAERYEVTAVADGVGALSAARLVKPDLVVLDIGLPGDVDGLGVAQQLRQVSDVPIIFLTAVAGPEAVLTGFAAGADDYLSKPFLMDELTARVRAVLRRSQGPQVLRVNGLVLDRGARQVTLDGADVALTSTEFDLLSLLLEHRGRVVSKDDLLRQVWGFTSHASNVVETHVSALRRKLEGRLPRLIHTVRGAGYIVRS